MKHAHALPRTAALIALAASAALMAGCSSSTKSASDTTTSITVPGQTTIPYSAKLNARSDATITTPCTQNAAGAWQASGTVKNSATTPRGYQIVIDFVDSGATVEDTRIVDVSTVAPAATSTWSTSGASGKTGISCVIRQVQFTTSG
jgi:hypothetical protein